MAGADSSADQGMLRDIAAKRSYTDYALSCRDYKVKQKPAQDEAAIITQVIATEEEVLNAPDSGLTPAEKQGLLARVIDAVFPENERGLR